MGGPFRLGGPGVSAPRGLRLPLFPRPRTLMSLTKYAMFMSSNLFWFVGVGKEPKHVLFCLCVKVQERFEVDIKELPEQIDTSTYSKLTR